MQRAEGGARATMMQIYENLLLKSNTHEWKRRRSWGGKTTLRKEKWKQPEAKPEPRRPPESCSACGSTASPGHWSIWGTTNPEGRLPGFSTNMWKTLQIVFCFSQVIFFQNNSLLSGFRKNPLWSQNQMGKCLITCRVLSARRKPKRSYLETRLMRLQVENSERAGPGSCFHRLFWMLQKKIKYRLYTLCSGFSEWGGEWEGCLVYLLGAEIALSCSYREL